MKRVIIAALLLASAVIVSVLANVSFEKNMKSFAVSLENLIVYSENSNDENLKKRPKKLLPHGMIHQRFFILLLPMRVWMSLKKA